MSTYADALTGVAPPCNGPNAKIRFMLNELTLSVGETIYGLGERFGPFVKNGQSVGIWNQGESLRDMSCDRLADALVRRRDVQPTGIQEYPVLSVQSWICGFCEPPGRRCALCTLTCPLY